MAISCLARLVLGVRTIAARRVLTGKVVTRANVGSGENSVVNHVRQGAPRVLSMKTARHVLRVTTVLIVVRIVLGIAMADVNLTLGRVMLVKVAIMDHCAITDAKIVPILDVIKMELAFNVTTITDMD